MSEELWRLHAGTLKEIMLKMEAENARLKAQVEMHSKPATIGGYNLSQYIRMANSETLEFDNGDIFADMTLPERIKYIVESHARLKAEVERLKAEPDALTAYLYADTLRREDIKTLKAQVKRLTKAGDAFYESEIGYYGEQIIEDMKHTSGEMCRNWNAAKEGKKS